MKKIIFIFTIICSIIVFQQCSTSTAVNVTIDKEPLEKLSDYRFFVGNTADLQINEGVVPYDLNTPLFSDYAKKSRFVWMPNGQSAKYTTETALDFPKGTVLIKNFYYVNDETQPELGRKIIETRLLIHQTKGWEAHSYVWNEEQTEAYYDIIGDIRKIDWINAKGENQSVNYIIPNKNQCKGCHSYKQKLMPIGPKVRNLNKSYAYESGQLNQLEKWVSIGYLMGFNPKAEHPKVAAWDDENSGSLTDRAVGYLDINCGHCHNLHGPAGTTGLNLIYGADLDLNLGINKPPVAAGRASGGFDYSILAGEPKKSIMTYRMNSTEPGVMMPELGRTSIHEEGLALIEEWIKQMEI